MSGINILEIKHGGMVKVIDAKSADYNTMASLTAVKCDGYSKLFVQYIISTTSWDRAGNIVVYGAFYPSGTYTALDDTIENATFAVTTSDDAKVGAGEVYIVESVPPWIKVGWDNTTAGTTGTITVLVMPFNG